MVPASALEVLDAFARPRTEEQVARALRHFEPDSLRRLIRQLARAGLLVSTSDGRRRASRLKPWGRNLASAFYHSASRDQRFLREPAAIERFLRTHVIPRRRPNAPGRERGGHSRPLPAVDESAAEASALERVLAARRTVRAFSRSSVALEDLAAIVRGTWGQTGWIDAGPLGRLMTKTSPSAGALHPIECYVLAWNVRGLAAGLYRYEVGRDALSPIRRGVGRLEAVKAASGQKWIGGAAFVCIMTAVFARTLWKYDFEGAYRVLWLEAGHLCQTFDLLATARGLGSFQTAALADSFVEDLVRLRGAREIPLYLCGAGHPARGANPLLERLRPTKPAPAPRRSPR
jgi:SagB-type dehydrogenase family enzyme